MKNRNAENENIISMEKKVQTKKAMSPWRRGGAVAAAALAILVVTPNISPAAAEVMGNLPVIGGIVKVVTIRNYQMDDGNHQADVSVPKVEAEQTEGTKASEAVAQMNQSAEEYTDMLIKQFESEIAETPDGHQALDVDYEVVKDTADWFTLKIQVLETRASGYQHAKYYNLNKKSGEIVLLKDLFQKDADYRSVLVENIRQQMQEQMKQDTSKTFFLDDVKLDNEEQNFYLNQDNNLVIVFDEYDVAPGYMGMQEFVIPQEAIEAIRAN